MLPLSHDEVVHGKGSLLAKMPGDAWQKFANLRALFGLMWGFPGKKLLFMGGDIGEWNEWNHERSLDWHLLGYENHRGLQRWVADLNRVNREEPALHEVDFEYQGFDWIDFQDAASSVISFERKRRDGSGRVIVLCNFTPVPRHAYRIGVGEAGNYREILNSDAAVYGGSNVGNAGVVASSAVPVHGRQHSLELVLPPLSVLYMKRA